MSDLFDRFAGTAEVITSHAADSLDTWGPPGTAIAVASGSVYSPPPSATNDYVAYSSTVQPTDCEASIVLGVNWSAAGIYQAGIALRCSGTAPGDTQGYVVRIYNSGNVTGPPLVLDAVRLDTNNSAGGTYTVGSDHSISTPNPGDTLTVRCQGSGSTVTITAYLNGTLATSWTDTGAHRITTAGQAGVWLYQSGTSSTDVIRTVWAGAIGGPAESITPSTASVQYLGAKTFAAGGLEPGETVSWSAVAGSVTMGGYTAPASGSSDTVTWTSVDLPLHRASATITLTAPPPPADPPSRKGVARRRRLKRQLPIAGRPTANMPKTKRPRGAL